MSHNTTNQGHVGCSGDITCRDSSSEKRTDSQSVTVSATAQKVSQIVKIMKIVMLTLQCNTERLNFIKWYQVKRLKYRDQLHDRTKLSPGLAQNRSLLVQFLVLPFN